MRQTLHLGILLVLLVLGFGIKDSNSQTIDVGTLPPGKSIAINYSTTIDQVPAGTTQISNQGTVSATNPAGDVLTDDPDAGGTEDPTVTAVSDDRDDDGTPDDTDPEPDNPDIPAPPGDDDDDDDDDGGIGDSVSDIQVLKIEAPDPVQIGTPLTYEIVIFNNGPDAAPDVVVTDILDISVEFVSVDTTQGECSELDGEINCALGTLSNEAFAVITIVVTPQETGTIENSVVADGMEDIANAIFRQDSDLENNSDLEDTEIVSEEVSTITFDEQIIEAQPGEEIELTLTLENNTLVLAEEVVLEDNEIENQGFEFTGGEIEDGEDCELGSITCEVGDILAGESIDITIQKVAPLVSGIFELEYIATSNVGEFRGKVIVVVSGDQIVAPPPPAGDDDGDDDSDSDGGGGCSLASNSSKAAIPLVFIIPLLLLFRRHVFLRRV